MQTVVTTVIVVTATPFPVTPTPAPPGPATYNIPEPLVSPIIIASILGMARMAWSLIRLEVTVKYLSERVFGWIDVRMEQVKNTPLQGTTEEERRLHQAGPLTWNDEEMAHMVGYYRREYTTTQDPAYKLLMLDALSSALSIQRWRTKRSNLPRWIVRVAEWAGV